MKGIFILSHHKTPGAFVDREFPSGICAQSGFGPDEENRIYFFNRMRNSEPNYVFVKVKGQQIGSYFSGLDPIICTGSPNQCVCVIFEVGENPAIWEEGIRQLTLELLPVLAQIRAEDAPVAQGLSKDQKYREFDQFLAKNFQALQKGEPILGANSPEISFEATPTQEKTEPSQTTPSSEGSIQIPSSQSFLEVSITENEEQSFEDALKTASTTPDTTSHELQQTLSSLAQGNEEPPEAPPRKSDQATGETLELQLKQSHEQISEESISKINLLSEELVKANKKTKEMWVSLSQRQAKDKQQITTLEDEITKLKVELHEANEKIATSEVSSRNQDESKDLRSQLVSAIAQIAEQKEQLRLAQEKSTSSEIPSRIHVEIDDLRSQLAKAKMQIVDLKDQLQKALVKVSSQDIPSKIHEEIADLRSQLISAKKTVKVQRRDIVNLKNMLDLS